eukprot:TRINITY_DN48803_c0_g1_i1.p1 TRINITY_DN48803_c0_g1~~TRINITY_DN48803_c0_g1_i1.p1  ORF type:complete len:512 (+),score=102.42 TRINITY_DN48803_c0_g1_i1:67-1602(+)
MVCQHCANFCLFALTFCAPNDWNGVVATEGNVRGVSPDEQSRYACEGEPCTFACLAGTKTSIPFSAVNDQFCDCEDGSDEPGTSACAGQDKTLFYCANVGGVPRMIYTSRVDDGICDCCDGTDEVRHGLQCPNNCEAEAKKRKELVERMRQGLVKHKEGRREAKNTRYRWREEIQAIQKELPELKNRLEQAKAAQTETLPAAVASRFDEMSQLLKSMQDEINSLRSRQDELIAENNKLREMASACSKPNQPVQEPVDDGTVKQVSEYTKWMDNSEQILAEQPKQVAEEKPDKEPAKPVSEYAKWMDNSAQILADAPKATSSDDSPPAPGADQVAPIADATDAKPSLELDDAGRKAGLDANQTELQGSIDAKMARVKELEEKLALVPKDKLAYFPLMDVCLESAEYVGHKYQLCFFNSASQSGGTQGNVSLGSWSGWKSQTQASFKNGRSCGSGVNREILVKFECAAESKITEVTEPGHCVYEATVTTPGACDKSSLPETGQARTYFPKDEL